MSYIPHADIRDAGWGKDAAGKRLIPHHYIKNNQFPSCVAIICPQQGDAELFKARAEFENARLGYKAYEYDSFGQVKFAGRRTPFALVNAETRITRTWAAGDASIRLAPSMKFREAPPNFEEGPGLFVFPEMEVRIFMGYSKTMYQDPIDWADDTWWLEPTPQIYPVFWGVVDTIKASATRLGVYYEIFMRDKMRYFIDTTLFKDLSVISRQQAEGTEQSFVTRFLVHQNIIDQTFFTPGVFNLLDQAEAENLSWQNQDDCRGGGNGDPVQSVQNNSTILAAPSDSSAILSTGFTQFPCDAPDFTTPAVFGNANNAGTQTRKPYVVDLMCLDGRLQLTGQDSLLTTWLIEQDGGAQIAEANRQLVGNMFADGGDCNVNISKMERDRCSRVGLLQLASLIIENGSFVDDSSLGAASGYYNMLHGDAKFDTFFKSQTVGNQQVAFIHDSTRELLPGTMANPQNSTASHYGQVTNLFNLNVKGQPPIDVMRYMANAEMLPTELFVDHRIGHFFYIPRSTTFREDNTPMRLYAVGRGVEIDGQFFPPNVIESQLEWTTHGYKNNFHINQAGTGETNQERTLNFYLSFAESPSNRILPNYIAPRHMTIADPTANTAVGGAAMALATGVAAGRILSRDLKVGTIVVDGDPMVQPGFSCWVFNGGLFNANTLQIQGPGYLEASTVKSQADFMRALFDCYENTGGEDNVQGVLNLGTNISMHNNAVANRDTIVVPDEGVEIDQITTDETINVGGRQLPADSRLLLKSPRQVRTPGHVFRADTIQHIFCVNLKQGYRTELLLGEIM